VPFFNAQGNFNDAGVNDIGGAISGVGSAVSDLFAAEGAQYKAEGEQFEKENYQLASTLADQNEQFTKTSTAIKEG
jgi:hypothetical protein